MTAAQAWTPFSTLPDGTLRPMRDREAIEMQLHDYEISLELWRNGYLAPTEPDADERARIIERLKVGIAILKWVLGGDLG
jgi:hypothetical protein